MNGHAPRIDRPPEIETERLRLVVILADEVEALVAGDTERASRLLGATFLPGWPQEPEARMVSRGTFGIFVLTLVTFRGAFA